MPSPGFLGPPTSGVTRVALKATCSCPCSMAIPSVSRRCLHKFFKSLRPFVPEVDVSKLQQVGR